MKGNKWFFLILLSLMWGSSFILMKKALLSMSPIQIGAIRILIAGIMLLTIGVNKIKTIQKKHWKPILITAYSGTFFPAFLFAYAISKIDSSVSAILNSLTPLITLLLGVFFFSFVFTKRQLVGIIIGFLGTMILILRGAVVNPNQDYRYALLILVASVGYALSMNVVKSKLSDLDAISITVGCFVVMMPPAIVVLCFSGFFEIEFSTPEVQYSLFYVVMLAFLGTTIAKVVFNKLVQISTPVFSSSITYLITVVAVFWGVVDGEKLSLSQFGAVLVIFYGVYLVNNDRLKQSKNQ